MAICWTFYRENACYCELIVLLINLFIVNNLLKLSLMNQNLIQILKNDN